MSRLMPVVLLLAAGCGLSNAMYNARQRVADAERAAMRGDTAAARAAYLEAIDKAANLIRDEPDGDAAPDALLLVAHARSGLGEHAAAAAALRRMLAGAADPERRARAHALLGGALVALGDHSAAAPQLDSALVRLDDGALYARARLWRARTRFASGDPDAWNDLDAAVAAGGAIAAAARMEAARRAVEAGDDARALSAFRGLMTDPAGATHAGELAAAAVAAASRWDATAAHVLLDGADRARWPPAARDSLLLARARLAAHGDPEHAIAEALALARRSDGPVGDAARLDAVRWSLGRSATIDDVTTVRDMLLPVGSTAEGAELLDRLRTLELLVDADRARDGPLALFAAAELARDELRAPLLAAELFRAYAELDAEAVWAPKALLASATLDPARSASLEKALSDHADNPYVIAWTGSGTSGGSFERAEAELARRLAAVRQEAQANATRARPAEPADSLAVAGRTVRDTTTDRLP